MPFAISNVDIVQNHRIVANRDYRPIKISSNCLTSIERDV